MSIHPSPEISRARRGKEQRRKNRLLLASLTVGVALTVAALVLVPAAAHAHNRPGHAHPERDGTGTYLRPKKCEEAAVHVRRFPDGTAAISLTGPTPQSRTVALNHRGNYTQAIFVGLAAGSYSGSVSGGGLVKQLNTVRIRACHEPPTDDNPPVIDDPDQREPNPDDGIVLTPPSSKKASKVEVDKASPEDMGFTPKTQGPQNTRPMTG